MNEKTGWEFGTVSSPDHPVRSSSTLVVRANGHLREVYKNGLYRELVLEIEFQHDICGDS